MDSPAFIFTTLIIFHSVAFTTGSDGLESIQLNGPEYVREGEDFVLSCQYDIHTRLLYAVKWYHGTDEFYRFLPKESPPQQVFNKTGCQVNVTSSNDHQVVLTNTSNETSGQFKCVVSEENTFKTLQDSQNVTVVAIGYDSPTLFVDQVDYSQGDTARANCSIHRTSHPANITWYINDAHIPESRSTISTVRDTKNPLLISTISTLTFQLPETASLIRLKCTGQLFSIYTMSSEMPISLKPRRLSMMSTSPGTLSKSNETGRGFAHGVHHQSNLKFFLILPSFLVHYCFLFLQSSSFA